MRYIVIDPCHMHRSKFRPTRKFMERVQNGEMIEIGKYENLISLTESGDGCFYAYRHSKAKENPQGLYWFDQIGVDAGMIGLVKLGDDKKQMFNKFVVSDEPYTKVRLHSNGVIGFYNGVYTETIYIDTNGKYNEIRFKKRMQQEKLKN